MNALQLLMTLLSLNALCILNWAESKCAWIRDSLRIIKTSLTSIGTFDTTLGRCPRVSSRVLFIHSKNDCISALNKNSVNISIFKDPSERKFGFQTYLALNRSRARCADSRFFCFLRSRISSTSCGDLFNPILLKCEILISLSSKIVFKMCVARVELFLFLDFLMCSRLLVEDNCDR